jgi:molecular chaperone GrpE (heat shock protein)
VSEKPHDGEPIELKDVENPELYIDEDMDYDEPQEYVYIDSHSVHLIKILIQNRNILKELIMEKDDEIDQLKAKIKDFEDNYNSVPEPQSFYEEEKEEPKQQLNEDMIEEVEDDLLPAQPQNNSDLLHHLERAERMVDHYKELLTDLHSTYNFPEEILNEFEVDANAILEKSFDRTSDQYGDDMDTDPNNILDTSFDEPIPLKDNNLEVSHNHYLHLIIDKPYKAQK